MQRVQSYKVLIPSRLVLLCVLGTINQTVACEFLASSKPLFYTNYHSFLLSDDPNDFVPPYEPEACDADSAMGVRAVQDFDATDVLKELVASVVTKKTSVTIQKKSNGIGLRRFPSDDQDELRKFVLTRNAEVNLMHYWEQCRNATSCSSIDLTQEALAMRIQDEEILSFAQALDEAFKKE